MRWLLTISISLAALWGCSLEDALENAPCETNEDCLGSYTCVRTLHQNEGVLPGFCRNDGQCAPGLQEGCRAPEAAGSCGLMDKVCVDGTLECFCCDLASTDDVTLIVSEDGTSAQCIECPTDLCSTPTDEPCRAGDDRCQVAEGQTCGCRVPAEDIEDSLCDDQESCGTGFECTRTLEQEMETQESLPEEQAIEQGWCRPSEMPECVGGQQEGCRTEDSCPGSGLNFTCTEAGRCYCCGDPPSSSFNEHVYAETSMGESAACIDCPTSDCEPGTTTCTMLEDSTCIPTGSGPCGCTPM